MKRFINISNVFNLKVGEQCKWRDYTFKCFYHEDDKTIEPDIFCGVDVYDKNGLHITSIHSMSELDDFRRSVE